MEKFRFRKFRIRENMWWTRYRMMSMKTKSKNTIRTWLCTKVPLHTKPTCKPNPGVTQSLKILNQKVFLHTVIKIRQTAEILMNSAVSQILMSRNSPNYIKKMFLSLHWSILRRVLLKICSAISKFRTIKSKS